MALWSDGEIENEENYFYTHFATILNINDEFVIQSLSCTNTFYCTNKKDIPYFNYSNPVKHFTIKLHRVLLP
jgi:hypothetical protein